MLVVVGSIRDRSQDVAPFSARLFGSRRIPFLDNIWDGCEQSGALSPTEEKSSSTARSEKCEAYAGFGSEDTCLFSRGLSARDTTAAAADSFFVDTCYLCVFAIAARRSDPPKISVGVG